MFVVVGLGNPGSKYTHTRHNVGFDVTQILAEKMGIMINRAKCHALVGEGVYQGERMVLAQPQTFMNDSGRSVMELAGWYKPAFDRLVIVYDDIDLPPGKLRVRAAGSAGTHNGMRSIVQCLGREDFPRVRVGIGTQPEGWELADWVLSHYVTAETRKIAFDGYLAAADAILCMAKQGIQVAMQEFNHS